MNREGTMKSYWDQIFLSAIEMRLALSRWNSRTLSPLNWSEFSTFIYSDLEEKNHCSCPGSSSPSFGNCTLISVCEQSQLLWGNQNTAWLWPCHWFRGRHVPQATPKRRSPGLLMDVSWEREMLSSPGDGSGEVSMLNWYQCGKTLHGDHLCQTGKINQHQRGKTGR